MKPIITLACIGLIMGNVAAQDDLLADLESLEGPSIAEPVYATFKGSKIVNLQTVELPAEGEGQFIISHRFAALNDRPLHRNPTPTAISQWLRISPAPTVHTQRQRPSCKSMQR